MLCYFSFQTIVYSPKNEKLEIIMQDVAQQLSLMVEGYNNSALMEMFLQDEVHLVQTLAGVQFDDSLTQITELPTNLKAALR